MNNETKVFSKISEVMNRDVKTITPDSSVVEAAQAMRDGDFGAMPVCNGDKLQGMITDRDIALRVVAEEREASDVKVSEVMTADIITCFENDEISDIADLMAERQVRRIAVLNADKRMVGIVSIGDLALTSQDEAGEAMGGISEQRHDEPSAQTMSQTTH